MSTMDSEQFFLKWNNFESNLASGFADLLQKEAMVDVTIAAEGKIIQAHKIILSVCSSYFRNMFQVNPCQHPIVVLKDVRYQELTDMLDFMYKGEVNVRQEDLPSFLKLAETLRVKGLAVTQGELDESSLKKKSESQISNLTKNSSSTTKEDLMVNDAEEKEAVARKKTKRCPSPLAYPEARALTPPNIKVEMEECDNNFMRTNVNTNGQPTVVKEERLSDSSMDSYGESHVANENWKIDRTAGRSTIEDNSETVQQGALRQTRAYGYIESRFGKRLLILSGYSYRRKSGKFGTSYWVCCNPNCTAKGTLFEDGRFYLTRLKHNHGAEYETIKRREELVGLKKLALQMNVSGRELLQALDITDDIKKTVGFINTCRRRRKNRIRLAPLQVGLNYRHLPSRYSKEGLLSHSGYLYRKDSVNPRHEKRVYWRCVVKNCKARAKTDGDGNLTILKPLHTHSSEKTVLSAQTSRKEQETVTDTAKQSKAELVSLRKSVRLSQKRGTIKPGSVVEVANSDFCADSFNLEKLMAETLDESYCAAPELQSYADNVQN